MHSAGVTAVMWGFTWGSASVVFLVIAVAWMVTKSIIVAACSGGVVAGASVVMGLILLSSNWMAEVKTVLAFTRLLLSMFILGFMSPLVFVVMLLWLLSRTCRDALGVIESTLEKIFPKHIHVH